MRQLFVGFLAFGIVVPSVAAVAADPTGQWRVEDGSAHIQIVNCDGALWGVVAWEKEHRIDSNNPDPAKRNRPTLGMPIVLGMQPVQPNKWEGGIYNPKNGKTYDVTMTLSRPYTLEVEGCLVSGFLCGGQEWTRIPDTQPATGTTPNLTGSAASPAGRPKPSRKAGATANRKADAAPEPDVCSSLVGAGTAQ